MEPLVNDRWRATFTVTEIGTYAFKVCGWVDHFKTWARDLKKRVDAGQDVTVDLSIGAEMIAEAGAQAPGQEATWFEVYAQSVREGGPDGIGRALSPELAGLDAPARRAAICVHVRAPGDHPWTAERARFGAWYELFPRSTSPIPGRHGTFQDVIARLPYVASMGFDVLYLPPIHPIGVSFRKGPNNSTVRAPNDPGSPWAIGGAPGPWARAAIRPSIPSWARSKISGRWCGPRQDTGSRWRSISRSSARRIIPTSPQHPEWFKRRPDGTIQYAENPPKKYQDIYPFDFETEQWRELWEELKSVVQFWVDQGVRIFRVDNPHTKAFPFWAWLIAEIKRDCPEAIFLAEAFTRPKVLQRLAKLGFTQSYNYFPWRNTKWELTQYLTELTQTAGQGIPGPEPLAEHARHPDRVSAVRRPSRPHHTVRAGGHAGPELWHLRPRLRVVREPACRAGPRGVPGLGEVPDAPLGRCAARQPARADRPGQPGPPRQPGLPCQP